MPLGGVSDYNLYSGICFLLNGLMNFLARKQDAAQEKCTHPQVDKSGQEALLCTLSLNSCN